MSTIKRYDPPYAQIEHLIVVLLTAIKKGFVQISIDKGL
jgi:hypothetical protein